METWHTAGKLLESFRVIVLERDDDRMEDIVENSSFLKKYKNSFIKLENIDKIKLSSSYIRELVKTGKSITGMVPEEIEGIVMELYK